MKKLVLLALALCHASLHAQFTEEKVKVLDAIQGEALFSLEGELELYSFADEDGWYRVRREVYLKPGDIVEDKFLETGTELLNKSGEVIGECLQRVKLVESRKLEGFRSKDRFQAIVEGYLFKTKLADNSLPEKRVEDLLSERNRTVQQEGFQQLFEALKWEKREFEDLNAYVYREQHKTLSEEKDFRIVVIFKGEASPYAVITKDHDNISPPKIKAEWEDGPYRIIYFYKPTASQEDLVQNTILYTFLAL